MLAQGGAQAVGKLGTISKVAQCEAIDGRLQGERYIQTCTCLQHVRNIFLCSEEGVHLGTALSGVVRRVAL